jgi:hypothetical protein
VKENVKAEIAWSGKTMAEPKAKSKKMGPTDPVEEEEKAKAEVEAEWEAWEGRRKPWYGFAQGHQWYTPATIPPRSKEAYGRWKVQSLRGSNPESVHPHSDAGWHASPTYARYLKDILNQRWPIPETDRLMFVEWCSAAILDGLPDNMGDPGVPTISCLIGTLKFDEALCDLGASVSVMAKVIYDQLNHDSFFPSFMHLQLADQSIRCPVGIVEDISVRIRNSFVPVDFIVLEMDVYRQTPLILGRSFLSAVGATIDVAAEIVKLNISGKESFIFKPKSTEQCNQVMVTIRPERNAMTSDK